jgi:hypothetical protein
MDLIAELRLTATFADGLSAPVVVCVGRPYAHPKGDHACPVEGKGLRLWTGPTDIFGVGEWHALMVGLRFLRSMLAVEAERGAVFRREDDDQSVSVEELFVLHLIE